MTPQQLTTSEARSWRPNNSPHLRQGHDTPTTHHIWGKVMTPQQLTTSEARSWRPNNSPHLRQGHDAPTTPLILGEAIIHDALVTHHIWGKVMTPQQLTTSEARSRRPNNSLHPRQGHDALTTHYIWGKVMSPNNSPHLRQGHDALTTHHIGGKVMTQRSWHPTNKVMTPYQLPSF